MKFLRLDRSLINYGDDTDNDHAIQVDFSGAYELIFT